MLKRYNFVSLIFLILFIIISTFVLYSSTKLFIVFLGISALIFLITILHFEPFLSILIVSIFMGLSLGLSPLEIIDSVEKGNGALLGHLSLILGLGAMIGALLDKSKAVEVTAAKFANFFGVKGIQWGLVIAGMCNSFSLFFDVAFILLIPIVINIAKQLNINKLWLALPTSISILTIHALFPPHPSPSIIVKSFNLPIIDVMYYGLIVAIPTIIIGGVLLTKITLNSSEQGIQQKNELNLENTDNTISFSISTFILLLPVILITIPQLIVSIISLPEVVISYLKLISNPISALIITLIVAIVRLGIMRGQKVSQISNDLTLSAKSIATVLLINGAAGGLKQVLIDAKVTEEIVSITSKLNISVLLISFVVAAILRITLGSSTVSAITTLAIVEPMISSINYPATLVMLSIAAGSMFCSHVNDPGFWLFKQYLNLDLKTTFKTWTFATSIASTIAFGIILILAQFS